MSLLYIISIIAIVIQICCLTVSVGKEKSMEKKINEEKINVYFSDFSITFTAAGLYYVAELVEEYTVTAKKVITIIVLFVTTVYLLFMFLDNLPWSLVICGILAQALHAIILTDFPYVKFMSVQFIGAVLMLFVNHYLAFSFFTQYYYNFTEVSVQMKHILS